LVVCFLFLWIFDLKVFFPSCEKRKKKGTFLFFLFIFKKKKYGLMIKGRRRKLLMLQA